MEIELQVLKILTAKMLGVTVQEGEHSSVQDAQATMRWEMKKTKTTSLKIFKHYKLKPSFSIIKDEKDKDKVGVGDKPPLPKFQQFDQV